MKKQMSGSDGCYVPPSIGRIGAPYHDENNNRVKYFCLDVQETGEDLDAMVQTALCFMEETGATRMTSRFFVRERMEHILEEARIPLSDNYAGLDLLFLGKNTQERQDDQATKYLEKKMIAEVLAAKIHPHEHISNDYSVQRLTCVDEKDERALVALYQEAFTTYTTSLNPEAIRAMVEHSIVYAVREKRTGDIVSIVVAEMSHMETSHREFGICELSEMATKEEHRGKGLVTYATQLLIEEIKDDVDMIYAEARACHRAINQSFRNLGFHYGGRLEKHCILSGAHEVEEQGPYENLNVWYVQGRAK